MTGRNASSFARGRIGKFLAVLWILTAALAMQFVASAQGLSSRFSTQQNAGTVSIPESGTSDTVLSRHAVRAFPVADLRFTAGRSDGKASAGGPGPFVLPAPVFVAAVSYGGMPVVPFAEQSVGGAGRQDARVRGPPAFDA